MSEMQEALEKATAYEEAVNRHRSDILVQPDEYIRQSIAAMTKLRDGHEVKRVDIEADHRTRMEQLRSHYAAEKQVINGSINALETQLGELRTRWAKLNEEETQAGLEEKSRWVRLDAAQRKLIDAETTMIESLRS